MISDNTQSILLRGRFSFWLTTSELILLRIFTNGSTFDIVNENSGEVNSETEGISINLAWVLLLIPAGLAYIIIKRKFNPLKFLSRKKI